MTAITAAAEIDAPAPVADTSTSADELVESAPVTSSAPAQVGLVPRLLSMLGVSLPQFITDGTRIPSLPALVMAVFAAIGRELDRFFFNDAPVVAPRQVFVTSEGGVVFGTVGATDADGDPLVYTVTEQSRYGTVEVDANGIWIYTPKDELFSAGGECGPTACFDAFGDSFTVKVEDRGFNLRKLVAFLTGAPTGVTARVGADVPTTYTGAGNNQSIRVYEFHNATSGPIQLIEFTRSVGFMPTPPYLNPKEVLQPGETQRFEFSVSMWQSTGSFPSPELVVRYRSADGQTTWPVSFLVNRNESIVEGPGCRSGHGGGVCAVKFGSTNFLATNITWVFMDRPSAA
jgi:VCBS repeat-containing protein